MPLPSSPHPLKEEKKETTKNREYKITTALADKKHHQK